ncbi:hypothetical protein L1987_74403 [Smallanthus sonchifolius]|uniref:Uncharacterized protein n=1 Tax=Smallanthus sonchifolius TaxID=185202 RepID=A0ACB9A2U7_9ASTR|nr:hypothetical protein L1987_74403 [Smallanthus sonchifolius]
MFCLWFFVWLDDECLFVGTHSYTICACASTTTSLMKNKIWKKVATYFKAWTVELSLEILKFKLFLVANFFSPEN